MLGLEPKIVQLDDSHLEWALEFTRIKSEIGTQLQPLGVVDHIGSTAVALLPAKPIVDVAIGLFSMEALSDCVSLLTGLGFRYRGNRADAGGNVCDYRVGKLTTRHVHIVQFGSRQWSRYLIFRDYLRQSGRARDDYRALKELLAQRFSNDRRQYTAAKRNYIERLTDFAEQLPAFFDDFVLRHETATSRLSDYRQIL